MDVYQKLTIFTCVTSTITLILVSLAMLPHLKNGFVLVRDALLWVSFVLVAAGSIWIGVNRLAGREVRLLGKPTVPASTTEWGEAWTADHDPYYQGSVSD